ncbi:MAG: PTS sugar transporter subunit IIA [bacterium]
MTTKELAEYIKLNEKTVIKMAQNGDLPGKKIGNQWRFHLMAIDNFLLDNIIKSSDEDLNTLIRITETNIPLSRLTMPPLINLYLKSNNREEVLFEIAKIPCEAGLTPSIKILFEELKERERMLSTAVGDGIAIPHPRHPSIRLFKTPNIVICRTQKGINFDAPDNKKVHLFFLICAPDVCIHLRLLAKVSKLLHAKNIIQKFMEADSGEEIIKILLEFERQFIYAI